MTSLPSSNSWHGRFIGDNQRYRLDKRLAGGGMGEVFLATDTRVGQQVALKLLKDTLVASTEMRKRFEREISVCAALQSDHIVKISDCGVTEEGYPFYIMEYLRGQTLRHVLLKEKRLSVERTVSIIAQVCKGLQLAHAGVTLQREGGKTSEHIQVIHRDLKPDNIFLVPTDLGEWVKILDFGVAKIRHESSEQTNITNTFIGTFRYAAPEQIQSDENLDARADIYSLGLILYEMLSGADPFGLSENANNISEASWVLAHAYEPPKSLRSQPGCEYFSIQLEAVILKCLHKNPDNRFSSVEELSQALQTVAKSVVGYVSAEYQEEIGLHPTVPKSVGKSKTIERSQPLVEQTRLEDTLPPTVPLYQQDQEETILRFQPVQHPGVEEPTILRPLQPTETNWGQEETILRSQPVQHPGAEEPTILRPLQPTEPNWGQEETILRSQPVQHPGAEEPTILRPLQPTEPSWGQEETILRPQPVQHPGEAEENTPPQTAIASNQPEGTIFQTRPVTPPTPERTMFQRRPVPQPEPEGTIQSRPVSSPNGEPVLHGSTIFQRRTTNSAPQKTSRNFWLILGVAFAIGFALVTAIYIYPQLKSPQTNEQKAN
ncbi:protein kinase [Nostoc linckia FACHB-104]|nr:protein kinase [Nostoc linckia FACHB-104]